MGLLDKLTLKDTLFPNENYYLEKHKKDQIVLHHTASGQSSESDVSHWKSLKENIATFIIIDRNGLCWQLFHSSYWAFHLGVNDVQNLSDKQSIGIELDNWGWLEAKDGKYLSWADVTVPESRVISYNPEYRGYSYYEAYTEDQVKTLEILLRYLTNEYDIPIGYNPNMFEVNDKALNHTPGIWTHTSYRSDKFDCHPDPKLIQMLKSLKP